jgi:hypothetical protein
MSGQPGVAEFDTGIDIGAGAGIQGGVREAVRPRRVRAGRVTPLPAGPGRPLPVGGVRPVRSGRRRVRPVPARRAATGLRTPTRVAGWNRAEVAPAPRRGVREAVVLVLLGLGAALVVFALGSLADGVAALRVPDATGPVVVREGETLLQVAHRAAPSAEPAAVVERIVELNDLASPSVQAGRVLLSPIG